MINVNEKNDWCQPYIYINIYDNVFSYFPMTLQDRINTQK